MSQALRQAVHRETSDPESEQAGFEDAGPQAIRGRERAIHVWTFTTGNGSSETMMRNG